MDLGGVFILLGGVAFVALMLLAVRRMASKRIGDGGAHGAALGKQGALGSSGGEGLESAEDQALIEEALGARPDEDDEASPEGDRNRDQELKPEASRRSMRAGLDKTRKGLISQLNQLLFKTLDASLVDDLEALLISSDIGVRTSERLLSELREQLSRRELKDPAAVRARLRDGVRELLGGATPPIAWSQAPTVMMVIGVNGVGKTTTIGKLAARLTSEGKKVVLAAGDTFRAAATEQLEIWGERSGATVVKGAEGSDPSSVIFEAIQRARSLGADACICDTAGRLHTKVNLMEELKKLKRVMNKAHPGAPHEVMMVLDATTGQNAVAQARQFKEAVEVNSIALTKLDGTAKGGVVASICNELALPVRYIGIGEKVEDLRDFDPDEFVEALFAEDEDVRADREDLANAS